jgi:hypothetical protein
MAKYEADCDTCLLNESDFFVPTSTARALPVVSLRRQHFRLLCKLMTVSSIHDNLYLY